MVCVCLECSLNRHIMFFIGGFDHTHVELVSLLGTPGVHMMGRCKWGHK